MRQRRETVLMILHVIEVFMGIIAVIRPGKKISTIIGVDRVEKEFRLQIWELGFKDLDLIWDLRIGHNNQVYIKRRITVT